MFFCSVVCSILHTSVDEVVFVIKAVLKVSNKIFVNHRHKSNLQVQKIGLHLINSFIAAKSQITASHRMAAAQSLTASTELQ